MNRATLATLALGCSAVGVTPVFAAGAPVDSGRFAATHLTATLPGGDTLQLEFRGEQLGGGARLEIDVERCSSDGSCASSMYASPLPGGALSVDPSTADATLRAALAGQPLDIGWQPDKSSTAEVGGFQLSGDGTGNAGSAYSGDPASVTVQYDGHACQGSGGVGNGVAVDVADSDGSDGTRPVSALHLPDGIVLHC